MPAFLIIGAANFYGRALVEQLCAERPDDGSWEIRGVDKVLPQLASFPGDVLALYATIDYRMGNLRCAAFLAQAFARDDGRAWDFVFNFGGEQKFGQAAHAYDQDVRQLAARVAELSRGARVLVHLSTALVFGAAANAACAEDAAADALGPLARSHADAEASARAAGVPAVVLRPALCYGPGDRQNAAPMLIMGQLSRAGGSAMPVLWDRGLRISTVHVADVARAALAAGRWQQARGGAGAAVFNVADGGDTTNGQLAQAVGALFGVEPSFQNVAVNFMAKRLGSAELAEEVNQSLLGPWMDLLAAHGVANSPLSPYMDPEHPYCRLDAQPRGVDGSLITRTPGLCFAYQHPRVSPEALRPVVEEFQRVGLWPAIPI
ncbi:hypothetical protein IWW39_001271 [Coemansia spiralis]|uniref:NAD-dependent epimerase/dehydratase domain-containing protein n=1 Tax=Coemansia spiralis TaxID=417178 RepID=A0A9W8GN14_9FUNG|nr:hypothetical protein IWW39_001271 [Coemansia spiralis]